MIIRVPIWIKVVVRPRLPLIQRPLFFCLFAINLDVIMGIGALLEFLAATENHKAVHQQKPSLGKVLVQSIENVFIQPNARRSCCSPAFGRPQVATSRPGGGAAGKQSPRTQKLGTPQRQ